ncbi:DNA repair protein XRCC3-like [Nilaparvata lugens]|uniref:DNA repair protein XRCC3-like n=1 Tax=Nilaparvata lugens TaxID=108931 RepID=UPI00193EB091|nr:DNA repair protein XRCC3-like [Nilaparvata lugens]
MPEIYLQRLETRIADALLKAQVTDCIKILSLSDSFFLKLGNIFLDDLEKIRSLASESIQSGLVTASSSLSEGEKWERLTTGCPHLDAVLQGGISKRGITELSGESGSGKTQFGLQLTITVQLPKDEGGLNGGAVYICTEEKFPSTRLHQLFETFPSVARRKGKLDDLGKNILIQHISDVDGLKSCVEITLPRVVMSQKEEGKNPIRLVVIDSITAVFRGEYSQAGDMKTRAQHIRSIGYQLHKLARKHDIAILCINQVNSTMNNRLVPALGLAWSNLVTTRLQITRVPPNRYFRVIFAPDLPTTNVCPYSITKSGVLGKHV